MADWGGGPLPDGVLFGGTRPRCGTDRELGRELLGGGLRVALGEKRGIYEGEWGVRGCGRVSAAVFAPLLGDGRRPITVASMTLNSKVGRRKKKSGQDGGSSLCMQAMSRAASSRWRATVAATEQALRADRRATAAADSGSRHSIFRPATLSVAHTYSPSTRTTRKLRFPTHLHGKTDNGGSPYLLCPSLCRI